jgi:hypothetical protein
MQVVVSGAARFSTGTVPLDVIFNVRAEALGSDGARILLVQS